MTTTDTNEKRRKRKSAEGEKVTSEKKQTVKNRDDKAKSPCKENMQKSSDTEPSLAVTAPVEGVRT